MDEQHSPHDVHHLQWAAARRALLLASRAMYALFLSLALLTPAWNAGLFAVFPIATLRLGERSYSLSLPSLLPFGAVMLWGPVRLAQRQDGKKSAGIPWHRQIGLWLPPLALGALVLVRIWPVHQVRRAVTAALAVALLWGSGFFAYHNLTTRWLLVSLSLVLLLQGSLATLQFLKQSSIGLGSLGEAILTPNTQGASVIEVSGRRWLRAYGLMPHPNILGGYLSLALLACLGAWRQSETRGAWRLLRPLSGLALLVGVAGLFCTFSRSAWLGTCLALLYLGLMQRPWRQINWRAPRTRHLVLLVGVASIGMFIALGMLYGNLLLSRLCAPLEQTSIRERLEELRQAMVLIRAEPLLGVGPGYYVDALWAAIGNYLGPNYPGFRVVHDLYLLSAAELGIPGALLILWLLLNPPWVAWGRSRARGICHLAAGLAAAFLAAATVGLFDYYLYLPVTWRPPLILGTLSGVWMRAMAAPKAVTLDASEAP